MKVIIFATLTLACFSASAAEDTSAGVKFLKQVSKQVQSSERKTDGQSCKPQGAQCSMHGECCSNFCGRGQC